MLALGIITSKDQTGPQLVLLENHRPLQIFLLVIKIIQTQTMKIQNILRSLMNLRSNLRSCPCLTSTCKILTTQTKCHLETALEFFSFRITKVLTSCSSCFSSTFMLHQSTLLMESTLTSSYIWCIKIMKDISWQLLLSTLMSQRVEIRLTVSSMPQTWNPTTPLSL